MMIQINLLPIEELEDNVWWVRPTIICTCISVVFLIIASLYLGHLKSEVTTLEATSQDLITQVQQGSLQAKEYDTIKADIDKINLKISSLQRITTSKVSKYRPLIIIELLQSLKPENMWFSNIELDINAGSNSDSNTSSNYSSTSYVLLSGASLDPESVSSFMENLEKTKDRTVDSMDLRTQIYFNNVVLTKLNSSNQLKKDITNFSLRIEYKDREVKL